MSLAPTQVVWTLHILRAWIDGKEGRSVKTTNSGRHVQCYAHESDSAYFIDYGPNYDAAQFIVAIELQRRDSTLGPRAPGSLPIQAELNVPVLHRSSSRTGTFQGWHVQGHVAWVYFLGDRNAVSIGSDDLEFLA